MQNLKADGGVLLPGNGGGAASWKYHQGGRTAFRPAGKLLAVLTQPEVKGADFDGDSADPPQPRLLLLDLARGGEPEVVICPHGYCSGLAFNSDGKLLAIGGVGGVHLFDMSKK